MLAGIFLRSASSRYSLQNITLLHLISGSIKSNCRGELSTQNVIMASALCESREKSSTAKIPYRHKGTGCVIVAWARLDYRHELFAKLLIPAQDQPYYSDNQLILMAYLKWGEDCCCYIFGDYSFAIYDPRNQSIFCSRDHMGVKPFYYYTDDHIFMFSSSVSVFHDAKVVPMQISESWVVKYTERQSMDFENTAYKNIRKLPPANCLRVDRNNVKKSKYFCFDPYRKSQFSSVNESVEAYREMLFEAVKSRAHTQYPIGFELSGGIDSSSIAAIAVKESHIPVDDLCTFSTAVYEYEPSFIFSVCQELLLPNSYVSCGPDLGAKTSLDAEALKLLGYPVEYLLARHHMPMYKTQEKHDIRRLFSGFGGDEFVTSIYLDVAQNQLLHEGKYRSLYKTMPKNKFKGLLKYFISLRENSTLNMRNIKFNAGIVHDRYIKKHLSGLHNNTSKHYKNLNEFTLDRCLQPYISTRLENCTLLANGSGVEYVWPLLDPKLIQLFLSIPVEHKNFNGADRYIHRKATEHLLPKKVIWQVEKNMGQRISKQSINVRHYSLPTKLHPILDSIVDTGKLQKHLDYINRGINNPSFHKIAIVCRLNDWLNKYHGDQNKIIQSKSHQVIKDFREKGLYS